jgi:hypothetical protein
MGKPVTNDHRRHAIQTVAALPEEPEDALLVLELARKLVLDFLCHHPEPPAGTRGTVVRIGVAGSEVTPVR